MRPFSYPWMRITLLLLVVVGGGLLGFTIGAASQKATAASLPADLHEYTHDNTGECLGGQHVDPVNVIFTHHGFEPVIKQQAVNHGDWEVQGTAEQYFRDQEGCFEMEGSPASNCCNFGGRYHMRHYNHKTSGGGQRTDPVFGSISSASAHHEDTILDPFSHPGCFDIPDPVPNFGHAVDDNSEEFVFPWATVQGGYNLGREDIRKNWVENSDHVLEATLNWDNTAMFLQCDGQWAWSNGLVYYIRTFDATTDYDLDGCTNEAELQTNVGTETSGGRRDPANEWDYYDVNGDGLIDLSNDIFGVIIHYAPTGTEPEYDVNFDRGASAGPNSWNMTAPDGVIDLSIDILGVILQYSHDCR